MPFTFHRTRGRRRPSVTAATRTTAVLLPQHRRHGAALHHTAIIRGRARGVVMVVGVMPRALPALAGLSEGTDRDQIPSAEVSDTPRLVVARGWDGVVGAIIGGIAALWIVQERCFQDIIQLNGLQGGCTGGFVVLGRSRSCRCDRGK